MSTTRTRTSRAVTAAIAALMLAVVVGAGQRSESPDVLYQRALDKEVADGDYPAAIDLYKKVVDAPGVSPALAAQALVNMGRSYQNLRNYTEAQKAYAQVASKYASQTVPAAEAQSRLKTLLTRQATTPVPSPKVLTQVLSDRDRPGWTTVTPDGQYLLGASFGLQVFDLANRTLLIGAGLSARDIRTIVNNPPEPGHITVLSSNGKQVAFRYADGHIRIQAFRPDGQPSDGQSKVLFESDDFEDGIPFGWSADDGEVLALLTRKDHTYQVAAISVSNGRVRNIRSLDWRFPNRLSLSPDGRYIAYDAPVGRDSTNRDIFLLSASGGRETSIVKDPARDALPVWTPDGKAVVFVSDRSGSVGLWVVQVADGQPQGPARAIRPQVGPLWPIGFTRDGSFYYVTGGASGPKDLYTAEVDLSAATVSATRIVERRGSNKSPAYSPDGKSLAYLSQKNVSFFVPTGSPEGVWTIVVRTLASGEEREIPSVASGESRLTWFPDGQSLVYTGPNDLSGRSSLHRIDLNTGEELINSATSVNVSSPTVVSPDGKKIYYMATPWTLARGAQSGQRTPAIIAYEVATQREIEVIHDLLTAQRGFALSPDGNQLVFWLTGRGGLGGPPPQLRLMATPGGPARELSSSVLGSVIQWSADGKSLLLQGSAARGQSAPQRGTLWRVPTDGGESQSIGTTAYPTIETIRPDGKQIAGTGPSPSQINQPSQLWVDPNILTDLKR